MTALPTCGGTVTVTDRLALPLLPVQLSVKVLETDIGPTTSLLPVALLPDQAPEALHELALVLDHVSVDVPPELTVVGFAERETVGAGPDVLTLTVTERLTLPAAPPQVSVYVLVAAIEFIVWLPDVLLPPDHAPEAEHEVALVDDQPNVLDPPKFTDPGDALSASVGAPGAVDSDAGEPSLSGLPPPQADNNTTIPDASA